MKQLTKIQEIILTYIKTYISEVGYSPSIKDIRVHMGWKSDNAAKEHLERIKKKGYINTTDGVPRSIVVLTEDNGWISIKDKMPDKDNEWYLVYQGDNRFCREYDRGYWFSSKEFKYGEVTHWQPLPQPPSITGQSK